VSLLSSYIDRNRFGNADKLASFFGVIPATGDSSSIMRRGHMSKDTGSRMGTFHSDRYSIPEGQTHKGMPWISEESHQSCPKARGCAILL
jgi:hypothetical protein